MARFKIWALCMASLGLWLAGCNSEDMKNLKSDTQQLGKDIGPTVGNAALAAKVNTHLTMHKGIDISGLHVEASGKTVTISGHVRDEGMRKKVVNAIQETTGVEQVVNKLNLQK